ncbi:MAG: DsbA family protein [Thermodesulfobacteriota bacterium]
MRVKFLGAALLALCFFMVGSTSFAEPMSKDEAARLQSFFMNRFGTTVPPGTEVTVTGFEASPIEGFKEGVFSLVTDRGDQELPFIISEDGKYVLIGKPTSTADFKATDVKGLKQGSIPYGPNSVPVLVSEDGQSLMIGASLVSTKDFTDSGFAGFKKGTIQAGRNQVPLFIMGDAQYVILGTDIINTKDFKDTGVAGLKKGAIGGGGQSVPLYVSTDGKYMILGSPGLGTDILDSTIDPHKEAMDKISLANTPMKGTKDAQITVVEYSDFQCPFCQRGKEMLPQILKDYEGKVSISFKQYPLPNHNWAMKASIASLCAYDQSNDKFWAFHDKIFDNQKKITLEDADATFNGYAKELGLNLKEFDACVASDDTEARVKADMAEAQSIGVNSTPTFVINGMKVPGANPQGVKAAIDLKLSEGS